MHAAAAVQIEEHIQQRFRCRVASGGSIGPFLIRGIDECAYFIRLQPDSRREHRFDRIIIGAEESLSDPSRELQASGIEDRFFIQESVDGFQLSILALGYQSEYHAFLPAVSPGEGDADPLSHRGFLFQAVGHQVII